MGKKSESYASSGERERPTPLTQDQTQVDGGSDWLPHYYGKLIAESQFSHSRRDTVTNWGLTLFLAVLATYGASLAGPVTLPRFWKISLLATALGLLVRFFAQGMIAYSFLRRWHYLERLVESHWAYDKPTIEQLLVSIEKYDHGRRTPVGKRAMLWSQLRAGFILILSVLSGIMVFELGLNGPFTNDLLIPVAGLVAYLVWEAWIFIRYDQLKKPEGDPMESCAE